MKIAINKTKQSLTKTKTNDVSAKKVESKPKVEVKKSTKEKPKSFAELRSMPLPYKYRAFYFAGK